MASLQDLQDTQTKIEGLKTKKERAQGALDESFKLLSKEFKAKNLLDAQKLEKKMISDEKKLRKEFDDGFEEFEDKWGEALEDE